MFDFSHSYHRYPEAVQLRLDALYNDPGFDRVEELARLSPFPFEPLANVADFGHDSRNPLDEPDREFSYVDIGSVDTTSGAAAPEKMVGRDAISSRMRRVIHAGDVLVSTTRPTRGAIFVVPPELDDQICSTGFAVLKPKPGMVERFLFYALRSRVVTMQFERFCSGSGYPAINQEVDLPRVLVPKPPKEKQVLLISRLVPLESEAERLEHLAEHVKQEADRVLLSELGLYPPSDLAYCFRAGSEINSLTFLRSASDSADRLHFLFYHPKYSLLSELADRFVLTTLAMACRSSIHRGKQVEEDENGSHLLLKTVHLKSGYIDFEDAARVSERTFLSNPGAQTENGDVLMASTGYGSMGKVDVFDSDTPVLVDGHVSIIRLGEDYDPAFMAYYLRSHLGQLQVERWWTGSSGQIELPEKDLRNFLVISQQSVSRKQQERIAAKTADKLSEANTLRNLARAKRNEVSDLIERFILGEYES